MQLLEKIKEQKITISIGAIITLITTSWFLYSQYYNFKESIVKKEDFQEIVEQINENHESDIDELRESIDEFEKEVEEMLLIAKLSNILAWKEDTPENIIEAHAETIDP